MKQILAATILALSAQGLIAEEIPVWKERAAMAIVEGRAMLNQTSEEAKQLVDIKTIQEIKTELEHLREELKMHSRIYMEKEANMHFDGELLCYAVISNTSYKAAVFREALKLAEERAQTTK